MLLHAAECEPDKALVKAEERKHGENVPARPVRVVPRHFALGGEQWRLTVPFHRSASTQQKKHREPHLGPGF